MNKTHRRLIVAGVAVLLLWGGIATVRHVQKSNWIAQQVYTVSMSEMRQRTPNGRLEAYKLIPKPQIENDLTAYSVIYYPETRTTLATVTLSDYEDLQFYMVFGDGSTIKGWYMPELVKFNITHVAFEELESKDFSYLDFVDGAKLGDKPYDPKAESDARLARFSLALPPPRPYSWSNPAPSSSTGDTSLAGSASGNASSSPAAGETKSSK